MIPSFASNDQSSLPVSAAYAANFPVLIRKLKALNYRGPVTIEREISGPKQMEDIKKEKVYLEKLIA